MLTKTLKLIAFSAILFCGISYAQAGIASLDDEEFNEKGGMTYINADRGKGCVGTDGPCSNDNDCCTGVCLLGKCN